MRYRGYVDIYRGPLGRPYPIGVCEVVVTKAADEPSCVGVGHGYLWLKSFIRDDQVYSRSRPE